MRTRPGWCVSKHRKPIHPSREREAWGTTPLTHGGCRVRVRLGGLLLVLSPLYLENDSRILISVGHKQTHLVNFIAERLAGHENAHSRRAQREGFSQRQTHLRHHHPDPGERTKPATLRVLPHFGSLGKNSFFTPRSRKAPSHRPERFHCFPFSLRSVAHLELIFMNDVRQSQNGFYFGEASLHEPQRPAPEARGAVGADPRAARCDAVAASEPCRYETGRRLPRNRALSLRPQAGGQAGCPGPDHAGLFGERRAAPWTLG